MRQQERSLERERMLSAAGADLVAATSREEIDEVALAAARSMAGADLVTPLYKEPDREADVHGALLAAANGDQVAEPVRASLRALAALVALALERAALTEEVHRRRGEARFGSLVRHASDLITVIGRDGVITYQSPSIERLLGYDAEQMTGQALRRAPRSLGR